MTAELTDAQREQRWSQARNAIATAMHDTYGQHDTGRSQGIADLAMDALADTAAEILTDGTLMRGLNIENGVATLSLEPAREILLTIVASMRTMLDSHGAENYLETEISAPSISLDLADGQNPRDAYTVTIQRRHRPTPHEFRQQAEARVTELEEAMKQIRILHLDSPMGVCPLCIDADAQVRGGDGLHPYPCPTARLAGAQDYDPPARQEARR